MILKNIFFTLEIDVQTFYTWNECQNPELFIATQNSSKEFLNNKILNSLKTRLKRIKKESNEFISFKAEIT